MTSVDRRGSIYFDSPGERSLGPPSWFEWIVAVLGVVVQEGAFVSMQRDSAVGAVDDVRNPVNTFAVLVSAVCLTLACLPHLMRIARLAARNVSSVLFVVLVVLSASWSIHPDVTLRRAAGYMVTIALAAFLCVRFDAERRLTALSFSFGIAAIASLVCGALWPQIGVMQGGELGGTWKGVFPHKNALGPTMSVAVFVELLILAERGRRGAWHVMLLILSVLLVFLSRSGTALLATALYIVAAGLYFVWWRSRPAAAVLMLDLLLLALAVGAVLWIDPTMVWSLIGKDPTITGRTAIWTSVLGLVRERPLLGWGYRAMWIPGDPTTVLLGAVGAHNAFLEILLQLGLVGLLMISAILILGFWRAVSCCRRGPGLTGWFSLTYCAVTIITAQTEVTFGQNQVAAWLVFNVLLFGCGLELLGKRLRRTIEVH